MINSRGNSYCKKTSLESFCIGLVPFGGNFNDYIQPFISDMKKLEQGMVMNVQGENC